MIQDHSSDYKKVGHFASAPKISVIIPMAGPEEPVRDLLQDLNRRGVSDDIILSGPATLASMRLPTEGLRILTRSPSSRSISMNAGAEIARNQWLWFLHADTRLPDDLDNLPARIETDPGALWWFNLRFHDGPRRMAVNTLGVWLRSHWLGCPFGDQGFLMSRRLFLALAGFAQHHPYGEDHVFTWQCRRAGVALRCTGLTLQTSARRYQDQGWTTTTGKHLRLWLRQAWQQWRSQ